MTPVTAAFLLDESGTQVLEVTKRRGFMVAHYTFTLDDRLVLEADSFALQAGVSVTLPDGTELMASKQTGSRLELRRDGVLLPGLSKRGTWTLDVAPQLAAYALVSPLFNLVGAPAAMAPRAALGGATTLAFCALELTLAALVWKRSRVALVVAMVAIGVETYLGFQRMRGFGAVGFSPELIALLRLGVLQSLARGLRPAAPGRPAQTA
jgi:hypothetical protein